MSPSKCSPARFARPFTPAAMDDGRLTVSGSGAWAPIKPGLPYASAGGQLDEQIEFAAGHVGVGNAEESFSGDSISPAEGKTLEASRIQARGYAAHYANLRIFPANAVLR